MSCSRRVAHAIVRYSTLTLIASPFLGCSGPAATDAPTLDDPSSVSAQEAPASTLGSTGQGYPHICNNMDYMELQSAAGYGAKSSLSSLGLSSAYSVSKKYVSTTTRRQGGKVYDVDNYDYTLITKPSVLLANPLAETRATEGDANIKIACKEVDGVLVLDTANTSASVLSEGRKEAEEVCNSVQKASEDAFKSIDPKHFVMAIQGLSPASVSVPSSAISNGSDGKSTNFALQVNLQTNGSPKVAPGATGAWSELKTLCKSYFGSAPTYTPYPTIKYTLTNTNGSYSLSDTFTFTGIPEASVCIDPDTFSAWSPGVFVVDATSGSFRAGFAASVSSPSTFSQTQVIDGRATTIQVAIPSIKAITPSDKSIVSMSMKCGFDKEANSWAGTTMDETKYNVCVELMNSIRGRANDKSYSAFYVGDASSPPVAETTRKGMGDLVAGATLAGFGADLEVVSASFGSTSAATLASRTDLRSVRVLSDGSLEVSYRAVGCPQTLYPVPMSESPTN